MYPARERARALGIYSFGIPIGSATGIVFGGLIATWIDWRFAFFIVGLAGIMIAPLFKADCARSGPWRMTGKLPKHRNRALASTIALAPQARLLAYQCRRRLLFMMGYGLFFWLPSYLVRSFDVSILEASLYYGSIPLVGGIAGIWLGGVLGDRLGRGFAISLCFDPRRSVRRDHTFYIFGLLAGNLNMAIALLLVPTALGMVWFRPDPLDDPASGAVEHARDGVSHFPVHQQSDRRHRFGHAAIGWLSGWRSTSAREALRYSILAGTGFTVAAALLLFKASRVLDEIGTPEAS